MLIRRFPPPPVPEPVEGTNVKRLHPPPSKGAGGIFALSRSVLFPFVRIQKKWPAKGASRPVVIVWINYL